jgi:hypothetical protein
MSSTMMRSARVMRSNALATVSSVRWRRTRAPRSSMVYQATFSPASTASWPSASQKCDFPVPEGPQIQRFSLRPIHSRPRRLVWVPTGMEEALSSQTWKVFPVGNPARLRRLDASRSWTSSARRALTISAGSQRWAFAVGMTLPALGAGRASSGVGQRVTFLTGLRGTLPAPPLEKPPTYTKNYAGSNGQNSVYP